MTDDTLTVAAVEALLKRSRNRTVQYLCRAYLQYGPENIGAMNLRKLRAALDGKKVKP